MLAGLLLLSLGVQDLVRARVDLEPKDLWAVLGGLLRVPQMAVRHEEEVRKCGPKVGPVVVALELGPRVVDVLTLWAEDLDRACPGQVRLTHGKAGLPAAKNTGTPAEVHILELVVHRGEAPRGKDEPLVYEAIEHLRRALHELVLLLRQHLLVRRLDVQNEVQSVIVVRNLLVQPAQVELVLDVVLVHLAARGEWRWRGSGQGQGGGDGRLGRRDLNSRKEFVALQPTKPVDPRGLLARGDVRFAVRVIANLRTTAEVFHLIHPLKLGCVPRSLWFRLHRSFPPSHRARRATLVLRALGLAPSPTSVGPPGPVVI